jgi:hypothetical protein
VFENEIKAANKVIPFKEKGILVLIKDLKFWLQKNAGPYDKAVIDDVDFLIFCKDIAVDPWLWVTSNKRKLILTRSGNPQDSAKMHINTRWSSLFSWPHILSSFPLPEIARIVNIHYFFCDALLVSEIVHSLFTCWNYAVVVDNNESTWRQFVV